MLCELKLGYSQLQNRCGLRKYLLKNPKQISAGSNWELSLQNELIFTQDCTCWFARGCLRSRFATGCLRSTSRPVVSYSGRKLEEIFQVSLSQASPIVNTRGLRHTAQCHWEEVAGRHQKRCPPHVINKPLNLRWLTGKLITSSQVLAKVTEPKGWGLCTCPVQPLWSPVRIFPLQPYVQHEF